MYDQYAAKAEICGRIANIKDRLENMELLMID